MAYHISLMRKQDIEQVSKIDQEVFPTMLPPADYERELRTSLAHYVVVSEDYPADAAEKASTPNNNNRRVVGFAGMWLLADEAHITNIAVQESHRQQGIGELMFISLIDLALEMGAQYLTLEVRSSNTAAQNLYQKYNLSQIHVRKGYYTDNKEDALVMATEDIGGKAFRKHLETLKKAHSQRWGIDGYRIAR